MVLSRKAEKELSLRKVIKPGSEARVKLSSKNRRSPAELAPFYQGEATKPGKEAKDTRDDIILEEGGKEIRLDIYEPLGENVRQARQAAHFSQEQLASTCGVTGNYISRLERGRIRASFQNVAIIAKVLDKNIDELYLVKPVVAPVPSLDPNLDSLVHRYEGREVPSNALGLIEKILEEFTISPETKPI